MDSALSAVALCLIYCWTVPCLHHSPHGLSAHCVAECSFARFASIREICNVCVTIVFKMYKYILVSFQSYVLFAHIRQKCKTCVEWLMAGAIVAVVGRCPDSRCNYMTYASEYNPKMTSWWWWIMPMMIMMMMVMNSCNVFWNMKNGICVTKCRSTKLNDDKYGFDIYLKSNCVVRQSNGKIYSN